MKRIRIGKTSIYALIDDEDYKLVIIYKWYLRDGYARATRNTKDIKENPLLPKNITLHRLVLNFPNSEVDHKDRDRLNCQKSNLRLATDLQNSWNKKRKYNNSSKYKGVFWSEQNKGWMVYISYNKRRIYLGTFIDEVEAAKAYNKKAEVLFGEFANLNQL